MFANHYIERDASFLLESKQKTDKIRFRKETRRERYHLQSCILVHVCFASTPSIWSNMNPLYLIESQTSNKTTSNLKNVCQEMMYKYPKRPNTASIIFMPLSFYNNTDASEVTAIHVLKVIEVSQWKATP